MHKICNRRSKCPEIMKLILVFPPFSYKNQGKGLKKSVQLETAKGKFCYCYSVGQLGTALCFPVPHSLQLQPPVKFKGVSRFLELQFPCIQLSPSETKRERKEVYASVHLLAYPAQGTNLNVVHLCLDSSATIRKRDLSLQMLDACQKRLEDIKHKPTIKGKNIRVYPTNTFTSIRTKSIWLTAFICPDT